MEKKACNVELLKDSKYVWKLLVKGDCKTLLDDIRKDLGNAGRRYLNDRIIYEYSD